MAVLILTFKINKVWINVYVVSIKNITKIMKAQILITQECSLRRGFKGFTNELAYPSKHFTLCRRWTDVIP